MYTFFFPSLFFSSKETTELNLISTCCENAIAISSWKQMKDTASQGALRKGQILSSGTDFQWSHMVQIDSICIRLWTFPMQISIDVALYKLIPPFTFLKCWCCAAVSFHGHPDISGTTTVTGTSQFSPEFKFTHPSSPAIFPVLSLFHTTQTVHISIQWATTTNAH